MRALNEIIIFYLKESIPIFQLEWFRRGQTKLLDALFQERASARVKVRIDTLSQARHTRCFGVPDRECSMSAYYDFIGSVWPIIP